MLFKILPTKSTCFSNIFHGAKLYQQLAFICFLCFQSEFEDEYDVVKKIGEGWFSKVYLTEHRKTRQEVALKAVAINQRKCNDFGTEGDDESYDDSKGYLEVNSHANVEFLREYRNACSLSSHANILTAYDIIFQVRNQIKSSKMMAKNFLEFGLYIRISDDWNICIFFVYGNS